MGAPRGTGGGTPRKVNPRVHERRGRATSVSARIKHKRETEGELERRVRVVRGGVRGNARGTRRKYPPPRLRWGRNVREDEGRARRAALRAGRVGCSARRSPVWIGRGRGGAGVSLMELRRASDSELSAPSVLGREEVERQLRSREGRRRLLMRWRFM